jgi:hypothetical protein
MVKLVGCGADARHLGSRRADTIHHHRVRPAPGLVMTVSLALYVIIGVALVGSVLGVFVEKLLVAVLSSLPIVVMPLGLLLALRPYLERNPMISGDLRDALIEVADPAVLPQAALACAGGALLANLLVRLANTGQEQAPRSPRPPVSVKKRVAAVAERTPLQARTDRLAAASRPTAYAAPTSVYEVAPALAGPITASSVASNVHETAQADSANRRDRGRRRAILAGFLMLDDGRSCACRIVDVSDTGARVRLPTLMPLPDKLWLLNTSDWMAYEVELAWRKDAEAGLHFLSKRNLRNPTTERDQALHALCADLAAR